MLVVHFELGSIDASVFDLGVVRVLKVSSWVEPLDGAFVTKDAVDGEVGRLGRRLSTLDRLCAVWPGFPRKSWYIVNSQITTLNRILCFRWIYFVIFNMHRSFTLVGYCLSNSYVPVLHR